MRTVRVSEDTYNDLLRLKRGNDSFDSIVTRLLLLAALAPILERGHQFPHYPGILTAVSAAAKMKGGLNAYT